MLLSYINSIFSTEEKDLLIAQKRRVENCKSKLEKMIEKCKTEQFILTINRRVNKVKSFLGVPINREKVEQDKVREKKIQELISEITDSLSGVNLLNDIHAECLTSNNNKS